MELWWQEGGSGSIVEAVLSSALHFRVGNEHFCKMGGGGPFFKICSFSSSFSCSFLKNEEK